MQSQGFPDKKMLWVGWLATPSEPENRKFQKKAADSTGFPESSFSTPWYRLCTQIQDNMPDGWPQEALWVLFPHTQGFTDKTLSSARSPLSDVTAPAASSLFLQAVRSMPLYPKEIFSDVYLSKYQLLKIKRRQTHELSKSAIPNYMQLSTNPTKQELSGKRIDKLKKMEIWLLHGHFFVF